MTHTDDENRILSTFTRLKHQLEQVFGLLDELEVLSRREYAKVRSGDKTVYERNDALLDQCGKFLTALQQTDQHHVVNFITQNGGQKHNDMT